MTKYRDFWLFHTLSSTGVFSFHSIQPFKFFISSLTTLPAFRLLRRLPNLEIVFRVSLIRCRETPSPFHTPLNKNYIHKFHSALKTTISNLKGNPFHPSFTAQSFINLYHLKHSRYQPLSTFQLFSTHLYQQSFLHCNIKCDRSRTDTEPPI